VDYDLDLMGDESRSGYNDHCLRWDDMEYFYTQHPTYSNFCAIVYGIPESEWDRDDPIRRNTVWHVALPLEGSGNCASSKMGVTGALANTQIKHNKVELQGGAYGDITGEIP
jgi:hypothetical protein